jgi:hypothetical protein
MAPGGTGSLLGEQGPLRGRRLIREAVHSSSLDDHPELARYPAVARADTEPGWGWDWQPESDASWWDDLPGWAGDLVTGAVAQELAAELDVAGWFGDRPAVRRRLRDPGAPPAEVVRSAWIASFNPGLGWSRPDFGDSDPVGWALWDDPMDAFTWPQLNGCPNATSQAEPYTAGHTRTINRISDVAVGDLVFVLRTPPTDDQRRPVPDRCRLRRQAHLVGVWWCEVKINFPHVDGWSYPAAHCVPLVRFNEKVPIKQTRDWVPELHEVTALKLPGGIRTLTETEALALSAACSLPTEIFTVPNADLPALASALRRLDTGPVAPQREYMRSAAARYERTRAIELSAMEAVETAHVNDGFAVVDVSRKRRIGFDLAVGHPSTPEIWKQIEVKGTDKANDSGVAITDHELAAARDSVAEGLDRWWLMSVTQARHPDYQVIHERSDRDVASSWQDRVVNPGAAAANPLQRLTELPAKSWQTPPRSTGPV